MANDITRDELREEIAFFLGYGRSSDLWDADQLANVDAVLKSGVRNFYWPPPLPGIGPHTWSFLRPISQLTTIAEQGDYDLPADFGGLVDGRVYYEENSWLLQYIQERSIGVINQMRASKISSGRPFFFAVSPKRSDGTAPQQWQISFWPTPNFAYTINYQYQIIPASLDDMNVFPLGTAVHAETMIESCLTVAEQRMGDGQPAVHAARWPERLAASIMQDRLTSPTNHGYNGDRSDILRHTYRGRWGFPSQTLFDGQDFHGEDF